MRLEASIEALAISPEAHRVLPPPTTRALISQRHRVLYKILPGPSGHVLILRIYGPGQSSD